MPVHIAALVRRPLILALALACWLGAATATRAEELTELPLESLLETEVVSAARFARQITDAASAVSVLTSEDIRVLGLRTFGEVLDQMRGLHVSNGLDYVFLGARGLGGPRTLAGSVLLLIDGTPVVDNLYDQLYLGHDAILDVALIDRIEYAPGGGTAMYGNNAFLGVINVVTKRGRDIDGLQVTTSLGDWNERMVRVSGGQRLANGAEWLLSATTHANTGIPSTEIGDLFDHRIDTAHDQRLFFKASYNGFSVEAMGAQRRVFTDRRPAWYYSYLDRNEVVSLGHDAQLGDGWRSSLRLQGGRYAYRTSDDDTELGYARLANDGAWWAVDSQFGYDGLEGHRIVLGARVRRDPLLRYDYLDYDSKRYVYDDRRRSVGFSGEDEVTLSPEWRLTGGLRVDRRSYSPVTWSPRAALVWLPAPEWQLKLSHGRATRFASTSERYFGDRNDVPDERVSTSEFVTEYRRESLRLLGSVYRYRMTHLLDPPEGVTRIDGRGVELEAEWQWRGIRLRGSQAWQHAEANAGPALGYSPRSVTKLQASAPLAGEALRISLALRRNTGYDDGYGTQLPARTLLDLTLVSQKAVAGLDLRIGWRNLTEQRDHAADLYFETPPDKRHRSAWIELTGTFQ
ncbi:MAG TPA: TonB-dependent receptor [Ideonella sp.]|uniref:TonB-dependent receptor plug domain-containing protein n=1 Tax=Ideonella sp. TaxID=1929293 RepID=UPI002E3407B8|nr:TonB-dependent receptor [Ideonella sp.]HEX5686398.1 TonB-dependent receptor [Ideonella sp.]